MNTPTPAQALGDIGHWLCKYSDDGRYMNLNGPSSRQCFEVGQQLIKHGQHFAGLEAEAERLQENATGARETMDALRKMVREQQERAEAAEARCAELGQLLRDVWNRDGGKECRCINISRDAEREYESGHCPHQRIATFLAASGETK